MKKIFTYWAERDQLPIIVNINRGLRNPGWCWWQVYVGSGTPRGSRPLGWQYCGRVHVLGHRRRLSQHREGTAARKGADRQGDAEDDLQWPSARTEQQPPLFDGLGGSD